MRVELAYGRGVLPVELPDDRTTVIEPRYAPGLPDPAGALLAAIRNPIGTPPLSRLSRSAGSVAIAVCDVTRPMPSATVLPVLLRDLSHLPAERVKILVATGTHRANTPDELESMLGREVVAKHPVINHDAFDPQNLVYAGETGGGIPIWLNRHWVESDLRITTGFVEPHFFAGFSGGPKMVAPGLAGFDTTMRLHDAGMIGAPRSTWGVTEGNPIHDAIREIARLTGVGFSVDVTINRDHAITSAYAGELFTVHAAACDDARRRAMRAVGRRFDVVVATNSGYPLDQNLYQAVKGISAAAQVVRDGGAIVCAAECADGVPDHGAYRDILAQGAGPAELLAAIRSGEIERHDQWQVQIQAQIQQRADVYVKAEGVTPDEVRAAHMRPIDSVDDTVAGLLRGYGPEAAVCVLPQGPQTIPFVSEG